MKDSSRLEGTLADQIRVGRAMRIQWSCLLPALLAASNQTRCSCSPTAFTKAMEWFCCWQGATCGWDIFISSLFSSLSIPNKFQLAKWEGWLTMRQGFPSSTCMSPQDEEGTCHCGGTAASLLVSQLPVTFQTEIADLLLDF